MALVTLFCCVSPTILCTFLLYKCGRRYSDNSDGNAIVSSTVPNLHVDDKFRPDGGDGKPLGMYTCTCTYIPSVSGYKVSIFLRCFVDFVTTYFFVRLRRSLHNVRSSVFESQMFSCRRDDAGIEFFMFSRH